MEDKVMAHDDYAEIKCTRNTLKLLQVIKQLMYSNGSEELHTIHNQVMSTINLFWMRKEGGQSVQNFRDQFTDMRQVCNQLGLDIGQTEQGANAVLKKKVWWSQQRGNWKSQSKDSGRILYNTVHVHGWLTEI